MKVLLVNGSAHGKGCTYTALMEVAHTLEENGVEWELFQLGNAPVGLHRLRRLRPEGRRPLCL